MLKINNNKHNLSSVCFVHFSQWWSKTFLVINVNNYVNNFVHFAEVFIQLPATLISMLTFMSAQRRNMRCIDLHLKLNISKPWSIQNSEVYHRHLFWTFLFAVLYFSFPLALVEVLFSAALDEGSYAERYWFWIWTSSSQFQYWHWDIPWSLKCH